MKSSWWQVGLATLVVSALGALAGRSKGKTEKDSYEKFKQAPWSPPAWVFGPAWTTNNLFLLSALRDMLKNAKENKNLLLLQLPIWVIFFSFGYIFVNKKSPVLVATWTISDALLAAASFALALKKDKSLAYRFLPLLAWTTYASTVAGYQALKNDDPLLETPALAN